ncbi:hypothetical protein GCM10017788_34100 [Amycolatopsis acidiphila]|nr:hypothetical protein GCM10017788_34100 [Amycolatopsis acidiphila]
MGVGVAAEPGVRLEEGHVVPAAQHVGSGQAGDAGAEHGDPLREVRVSIHARGSEPVPARMGRQAAAMAPGRQYRGSGQPSQGPA